MTYLPDNTDYHYKSWDEGCSDALSYKAYNDFHSRYKDDYREGYGKGMDYNIRHHGGEAPDYLRGQEYE